MSLSGLDWGNGFGGGQSPSSKATRITAQQRTYMTFTVGAEIDHLAEVVPVSFLL